jgi:hypothetical protein
MMRVTMTFWTGLQTEGVLLAVHGLTLRVAIQGCGDAAELRFRGGQWFAECGDPVQIDFHPFSLDDELDRVALHLEVAGHSLLAAVRTGGWLN